MTLTIRTRPFTQKYDLHTIQLKDRVLASINLTKIENILLWLQDNGWDSYQEIPFSGKKRLIEAGV